MESFEKLCENEVTKYLLFVDINREELQENIEKIKYIHFFSFLNTR